MPQWAHASSLLLLSGRVYLHRQYFFNAQLLTYALFLLYAALLVWRENEQMRCVAVATRLGGIYDCPPTRHRWLDRAFLLTLGGLYAMSVFKDSIHMGFLLVHAKTRAQIEGGSTSDPFSHLAI